MQSQSTGRWWFAATLLLSLGALLFGGCGAASTEQGFMRGYAQGHAYAFFTRQTFAKPRRLRDLSAAECPPDYPWPLDVPKGLVCLREPNGAVPAEVCAGLPEGCRSLKDRRLVTPTDRSLASLVQPHGFRYGRCESVGSGRAFRIEPTSSVNASRNAQVRLPLIEGAYSRHLSRCCATTNDLPAGKCSVVTVDVLDFDVEGLRTAVAGFETALIELGQPVRIEVHVYPAP